MASRSNYARRRRNAFLAAVAMALVLVIIIVIIVVSISNQGGKKPTPETTPTPTIPAIFATIEPDGNGDGDLDLNTPSTQPTPDANAGTVMYVTGSTVNVRKEASVDSEKLTALTKGTSVTAYEVINGFYRVKLSTGNEGFISDQYLSETDPNNDATPSTSPTATTTPDTSKSKTMFVTGDSVNVRDGASPSANRITALKKGTEVTAYATKGDWTYIQYAKGKYGYISAKYLSEKSGSSDATPSPSATAGTTTPTPTPTPTPTAVPHAADFMSIGIDPGIASLLGEQPDYLKITPASSAVAGGGTNNGYNFIRIKTIEGSRIPHYFIIYKGDSSTGYTDVQIKDDIFN